MLKKKVILEGILRYNAGGKDDADSGTDDEGDKVVERNKEDEVGKAIKVIKMMMLMRVAIVERW